MVPAHSMEVLPALYASTYCELRRNGLNRDDAVRSATRTASIPWGKPVMVERNGQKVPADIMQAAIMVAHFCPHYLGK